MVERLCVSLCPTYYLKMHPCSNNGLLEADQPFPISKNYFTHKLSVNY